MREFIALVEGIWRLPHTDRASTDGDKSDAFVRIQADFRFEELLRRIDLCHSAETGFEKLWFEAQRQALEKELARAYDISYIDFLHMMMMR